MLFDNINDCIAESRTFNPSEEFFSLLEVGTVTFNHAKILIEPQEKGNCLLIYLHHGHIIVHHTKSERVILKNELVLIPLNVGAEFKYADAQGDFLVCANFPSNELTRNHLRVPSEIDPKDFEQFLFSLKDANASDSLAKLLKNITTHATRDAKQRDFIRNALIYMDKNISNRIMLEDIAATIDYSKFHFIRVFDGYIGQTPHQYICDRRLYLARDLLGATDLPIAEIAIQSGIHFTSNFYSHFKRKFKKTPKDYRDTLE
jgi:AraC-like DNA-binding protein